MRATCPGEEAEKLRGPTDAVGVRVLMTGAGARIGARLASDWDELPRVRPVAQCELQYAVYATDVHLAVRDDQRVRRIEPLSAGAHDDLADPVHPVRRASRVLRREPLVVAHVCVDDQLRSGGVEVVPERLHRRGRSEEHTSELQSPCNLVCRLLLEKKKITSTILPLTSSYQ